MAIFPYAMNRIRLDCEETWVAESVDLKNCFGVGDTQEEALQELESNEVAWIDAAIICGIRVPQATVLERGKSGC